MVEMIQAMLRVRHGGAGNAPNSTEITSFKQDDCDEGNAAEHANQLLRKQSKGGNEKVV